MTSQGRIGALAALASAMTLALGAGGASAGWRTLEAESLPASAGAQTARWAVRLVSGHVEAPVVLRRVDRVAVRMRGRQCGAAPRVRVRVDGRAVLSRSATNSGWRRYEARARVAPGRHVLRVEIANPGHGRVAEGSGASSRRSCARGLTVDWVAVRERIPVGAAVGWRHFQADSAYRHALMANFDSVTPENDMKFDALEPAPGVYSFDHADEIVALAEQGSLAVHGHALVFDRQLPPWVVERRSWAPGEVRELLRSYIHTVVGRYRGRIASWDVVNEPLEPDGSLAHTFFARHLGEEYIDLALRFAHEADPAAKLYVNEVATEELTSAKSDGLFALVQRLRLKGVPLDGVGFQFHANIGPSAPRAERVRPNLQRFADLGLELAVSEMDVRTSTAPGSVDERLGLQADVYGGVAGLCAEQPACVRFTTWGVTDRFSWLGAHERGLPFDWAGRAKPAWTAITAALR